MKHLTWTGLGCAALILLQCAPLFAQSAESKPLPGETAEMTDKARQLYAEGTKALLKGRWGEAHANLLAAWSLKKHSQIAGNLGTTEMQLGRYREAAEHLSYYVREAPKTKEKERQTAQSLLNEARKHVGALSIKVEPAGAEVFVDGAPVGKAPLVDEVFVDPGTRVIEARLAGFEVAGVTVDMVAGSARDVPIALVKREAKSAGLRTAADVNRADQITKTAGPSGRTGDEAGQRSKTIIIAGLATSAVMVGAGVVFAVVAAGKANAADDKLTELRQQVGDPNPCWPGQEVAGCNELRDFVGGRELFGNLAIWSMVTGGALGIGTAVYALTDSKPPVNRSGVAIEPLVSTHGGGVFVTGRW